MYIDLLGETIQQQALNIWASQHICKGFHITIDLQNLKKLSTHPSILPLNISSNSLQRYLYYRTTYEV
jgi:hypothetical protein